MEALPIGFPCWCVCQRYWYLVVRSRILVKPKQNNEPRSVCASFGWWLEWWNLDAFPGVLSHQTTPCVCLAQWNPQPPPHGSLSLSLLGTERSIRIRHGPWQSVGSCPHLYGKRSWRKGSFRTPLTRHKHWFPPRRNGTPNSQSHLLEEEPSSCSTLRTNIPNC